MMLVTRRRTYNLIAIVCFLFVSLAALFTRYPHIEDEAHDSGTAARKLLVHDFRRNNPYPRLQGLPDFPRALYHSPRLSPSNSFSAYNTYFDTGKRFWRKSSVMCTYDQEDKPYFDLTPAVTPGTLSPSTARFLSPMIIFEFNMSPYSLFPTVKAVATLLSTSRAQAVLGFRRCPRCIQA